MLNNPEYTGLALICLVYLIGYLKAGHIRFRDSFAQVAATNDKYTMFLLVTYYILLFYYQTIIAFLILILFVVFVTLVVFTQFKVLFENKLPFGTDTIISLASQVIFNKALTTLQFILLAVVFVFAFVFVLFMTNPKKDSDKQKHKKLKIICMSAFILVLSGNLLFVLLRSWV